MPRLRGERGTVWLSYCTNVRPVAGLDDLVRALDALWVPVRERLGLPCPLGLGLWLPAGIARELAAAPERARALREELHGRGLQAVTLNAFPYGEFFAERVKEQVYRPAWYERERLEYTVAAAQVLAELLPAELERGTISTLPLAWRPDFEERGGEAMLAGPMLIEAATALAEIEDRTGKRIQLGLEPEPGCVLETAEQARGFMLELCKGHSLSALFDRHLGVCVDCCHEAVMGEQPAAGLRALFEWGGRGGQGAPVGGAGGAARGAGAVCRAALAAPDGGGGPQRARRRPARGAPGGGAGRQAGADPLPRAGARARARRWTGHHGAAARRGAGRGARLARGPAPGDRDLHLAGAARSPGGAGRWHRGGDRTRAGAAGGARPAAGLGGRRRRRTARGLASGGAAVEARSKDFLVRLLSAVGPSGFEQEPARLWRAEAESFGAETWADAHGNSFARLHRGGRPRVMLAGHLDEIGFLVSYIDDEGYLAFQPVGGWDPQIPQGHRVWIQGRQGRVTGVIGKKPIHLLKQEERDKLTKLEDMWIDIGARDKAEAEQLVQVGDPVVLAWSPEELRNGLLVARGLDNRAGGFVVLEALRRLAGRQLEAEVVAVGTVQEEIGLRGARTAAFALEPEVGIAVDVTFATDNPGMADMKKKVGAIKIGGGPVLARGANVSPVLWERLVATAKELGLPVQHEAAPGATGTDANAMQIARGGIATALISVPNRYMHSPCEMCSLADLDHAAQLIAETVARLDGQVDLRVL
ncbi:MAG: hypothetical protein KatS3mg102_2853 [Planctomycetota bacterium]|nr:MAG: hypothetical protein KatS3mg102_2853 [Planctomycetota bacterium]